MPFEISQRAFVVTVILTSMYVGAWFWMLHVNRTRCGSCGRGLHRGPEVWSNGRWRHYHSDCWLAVN